MNVTTAIRLIALFVTVVTLNGCTRILGISKNDYRDGRYYPSCLVEADKALYEARQAGKNRACPDEYRALETKIDEAYKVHFGCNTEGACLMARDVASKARSLTCSPPPMEPKPAPAPAPPVPQANLSAAPASVLQGQAAMLSWTSLDATTCSIQPNIGAVQTRGTMEVSPGSDTVYSLSCSGAGGTAQSSTTVVVTLPPPPAPAPTPAPTPAPAVIPKAAPTQEQLCMTLNIEFATAKADIPARYDKELEKLANFMKEYPQVKGVIEGHTDNRGGKAYNERLSEKRARSVKEYLVKHFGIDGSRLGVKGYGFSKPVADNATAGGRQANRRIVANFDCVQH